MAVVSKTKIIASIIAIASLSSAADADGYDAPPLRQAATPQTVNWSGLYFGGHVGYGGADIHSSFDLDLVFASAENFLPQSAPNVKGWMGGGHIGVQHQHGNWVFGIEGAYDALDLTESSSSVWEFREIVCAPGPFPQPCVALAGAGTHSLRTEIDNLITITGRIGYTWDRWLAYVKGGYARAEVGLSGDVDGMLASCPCPLPVNVSGSSQKDHDGWTVGAGAEYMLQKNVTLGFEYDYVKLSSETHTLDGQIFIGPTSLVIDVDPDAIHAVSARLSILLNQ